MCVKRSIRGFTILELLVVVGIMVLLAAILITFWGKTRQSQARYQTMSNMRLISNGLRQYQLDENGLPPFDPRTAEALYLHQTAAAPWPPAGPPEPWHQWFGLWALIETGALESPAALHDPSARRVSVESLGAGEFASSGKQMPVSEAFFYCSFQTWDPEASNGTGAWMYLPHRGVGPGTLEHRRQLWPYPNGSGQSRWMPLDSTVVLWSRWHRASQDPVTPVLFMDGSIRYMESFTSDPNSPFIAEDAP